MRLEISLGNEVLFIILFGLLSVNYTVSNPFLNKDSFNIEVYLLATYCYLELEQPNLSLILIQKTEPGTGIAENKGKDSNFILPYHS